MRKQRIVVAAVEHNKEQQQQQHEQQNQNQQAINSNDSKKRKQKDFAPFGNYKHYYGYRIGHDMEEDPRLKVLRKGWFEGKDCLDIGCNDGVLTIQIAKKFGCRNMLGVDIDSDRVGAARYNIRKTMEKLDESQLGALSETPNDANKLEPNVNGSSENVKETLTDHSNEKRNLSDIVSFRKENFVETVHIPTGKYYDTISCFSVTKWIHLNWGDDGVITLFTKIWRLLKPGGYFVLEPQPWRSYESNRLTSEVTAAHYKNITFPPDLFQDMLTDKARVMLQTNAVLELHNSTYYIIPRWVMIFRRIFNWRLSHLAHGISSSAYISQLESDIRPGSAVKLNHETSISPWYNLSLPSLDEMVDLSFNPSSAKSTQPRMVLNLDKTPSIPNEVNERHSRQNDEHCIDEGGNFSSPNVVPKMASESRMPMIAKEGGDKLSKLLENCNIMQNMIQEKLSIYF